MGNVCCFVRWKIGFEWTKGREWLRVTCCFCVWARTTWSSDKFWLRIFFFWEPQLGVCSALSLQDWLIKPVVTWFLIQIHCACERKQDGVKERSRPMFCIKIWEFFSAKQNITRLPLWNSGQDDPSLFLTISYRLALLQRMTVAPAVRH